MTASEKPVVERGLAVPWVVGAVRLARASIERARFKAGPKRSVVVNFHFSQEGEVAELDTKLALLSSAGAQGEERAYATFTSTHRVTVVEGYELTELEMIYTIWQTVRSEALLQLARVGIVSTPLPLSIPYDWLQLDDIESPK